jgi:hypothetical protein
MGMTDKKFAEGVKMAIEAYRSIEKPNFENAHKTIQFIEIGLTLLNVSTPDAEIESALLDVLDATPVIDDTAAQEADVIDLADYRAKGGLLN